MIENIMFWYKNNIMGITDALTSEKFTSEKIEAYLEYMYVLPFCALDKTLANVPGHLILPKKYKGFQVNL